jgi:hypothetical protein
MVGAGGPRAGRLGSERRLTDEKRILWRLLLCKRPFTECFYGFTASFYVLSLLSPLPLTLTTDLYADLPTALTIVHFNGTSILSPPQIREFNKSPMQRGATAASNVPNNRVLPMFNYKSLRITLGKKSSSPATNPTQWWPVISSRLEFLKVKPSLDSNAVSCADPFWRVKSGSLSQRLNMTFLRFNF